MKTQDYLYLIKRDSVLKLWNQLPDHFKAKTLHALGLMFGEYRHLKTFENRKKAYAGNPVFNGEMKIDNLDFWAMTELDKYPSLTKQQKDTFINAANEWYLKQFN